MLLSLQNAKRFLLLLIHLLNMLTMQNVKAHTHQLLLPLNLNGTKWEELWKRHHTHCEKSQKLFMGFFYINLHYFFHYCLESIPIHATLLNINWSILKLPITCHNFKYHSLEHFIKRCIQVFLCLLTQYIYPKPSIIRKSNFAVEGI